MCSLCRRLRDYKTDRPVLRIFRIIFVGTTQTARTQNCADGDAAGNWNCMRDAFVCWFLWFIVSSARCHHDESSPSSPSSTIFEANGSENSAQTHILSISAFTLYTYNIVVPGAYLFFPVRGSFRVVIDKSTCTYAYCTYISGRSLSAAVWYDNGCIISRTGECVEI